MSSYKDAVRRWWQWQIEGKWTAADEFEYMRSQNGGLARLVVTLFLRRRVIVIQGELHDKEANMVIAQMLFLAEESAQPIEVWIDSPGGMVSSAMAIVDTMATLKVPLHTYCLRRAVGTAAMILASGTQGARTADPSAEIGLVDLTFADFRSDPESSEELWGRHIWRGLVNEQFALATQQDAQVIDLANRAHTYLTATDACAIGLIDRVRYLRANLAG